jgi:hypothetical protein
MHLALRRASLSLVLKTGGRFIQKPSTRSCCALPTHTRLTHTRPTHIRPTQTHDRHKHTTDTHSKDTHDRHTRPTHTTDTHDRHTRPTHTRPTHTLPKHTLPTHTLPTHTTNTHYRHTLPTHKTDMLWFIVCNTFWLVSCSSLRLFAGGLPAVVCAVYSAVQHPLLEASPASGDLFDKCQRL